VRKNKDSDELAMKKGYAWNIFCYKRQVDEVRGYQEVSLFTPFSPPVHHPFFTASSSLYCHRLKT
jgi:hypothetical protein